MAAAALPGELLGQGEDFSQLKSECPIERGAGRLLLSLANGGCMGLGAQYCLIFVKRYWQSGFFFLFLYETFLLLSLNKMYVQPSNLAAQFVYSVVWHMCLTKQHDLGEDEKGR